MSKANETKTVQSVIEDIKAAKSSKASAKDEREVMKSMLNDPTFVITNCDSKGNEVQVNPCEMFKAMASSIIQDTTKVSKEEAAALANAYDATNSVADNMIGISKQFVNTMLSTGRKVQLPNRPDCKCTLQQVEKPASTSKAPGSTEEKPVPPYIKVKAASGCPSWLKKK